VRLLFAFIGSVVLTGGGAVAFVLTPNGHRGLHYGAVVLSLLGVLLLVLALIAAANYGT
jgi:hypothetical protein